MLGCPMEHNTTQNNTAQCDTAQQSAQHNTTQHDMTQRDMTQQQQSGRHMGLCGSESSGVTQCVMSGIFRGVALGTIPNFIHGHSFSSALHLGFLSSLSHGLLSEFRRQSHLCPISLHPSRKLSLDFAFCLKPLTNFWTVSRKGRFGSGLMSASVKSNWSTMSATLGIWVAILIVLVVRAICSLSAR